jgi:hypothetical protein
VTTPSTPDRVEALAHGPLLRFADPIDPSIPLIAAGCYTIWDHEGRYLYAGMAGRSLTIESIAAARNGGRRKPSGLFDRLTAHRNGRRSGDQFCVYVFDYFVLPQLTFDDIAAVTSRSRKLDADVGEYIRDRLLYRWCETDDGATARLLERTLVTEGIDGVLPSINPGRAEES